MKLAALQPSLPGDFAATLENIAALGFRFVDLVGKRDRSAEELQALAESGLVVQCVSLGRGQVQGRSLDATDITIRRAVLDEMKAQITDAAQLGATHCYLVPGTDAERLPLFREACEILADHAAERMLRLCVEHFPGRCLSSCAGTLEWLKGVGHPNLLLLLDVGHCLISDEDPTQMIVRAGERLGYVHLDDNDSVGDFHWPLLTGRLTEEMLEAALTVLQPDEFEGGVALELNPANPDPVWALAQSKAIVERMVAAQAR
jgi:sugar phosphate isomerase/epimerase